MQKWMKHTSESIHNKLPLSFWILWCSYMKWKKMRILLCCFPFCISCIIWVTLHVIAVYDTWQHHKKYMNMQNYFTMINDVWGIVQLKMFGTLFSLTSLIMWGQFTIQYLLLCFPIIIKLFNIESTEDNNFQNISHVYFCILLGYCGRMLHPVGTLLAHSANKSCVLM